MFLPLFCVLFPLDKNEVQNKLRRMWPRQYYVYILTNSNKTVLYTGVTNNLARRLTEHYNGRRSRKTFTGRYNVCFLLYYETTRYINNAIAREKEIKNWTRARKEELIASLNPEWRFLNEEYLGRWPPE